MGASLDIQKEILKREYAKSPLGLLEKRLRGYWDRINTKRMKLNDFELDSIEQIRKDHEQKQKEYIERTGKEQREEADRMLFEAMSEEVKILEANENATKTI